MGLARLDVYLRQHALDLAERIFGNPDREDDLELAENAVTFRWYVGRTEPHHEHVAASGLIGRRFKVYLPEIPRKRLCGRKVRQVLAPMMPGYLFLHLPAGSERWGKIRATRGMLAHHPILLDDGRPAPIPDRAVALIRDVENGEIDRVSVKPVPDIKIGQSVMVPTGPGEEYYREIKAQVTSIAKLATQGRIRVAAELLGRLVQIEVEAAKIRMT